MKQGRLSPLSVAPAVASLVLALGAATVFSACGMKDDGTWMRCRAAQDAVVWAAVAMIVVLAAAAIVQRRTVRAALYILGAAGSVATFLVPGVAMPMCMMQTMRCYVVMQPFARIVSLVILVLCAACAVRSLRGPAKRASGGGQDL